SGDRGRAGSRVPRRAAHVPDARRKRRDRRLRCSDRDGTHGPRGGARAVAEADAPAAPARRLSSGTLALVKSFSLRSVRLRPGEEYRDQIEVELEPLELGGQRYLPVPEQVPAEFAVTRASTGTVFELRFQARLHGPCYRCLGDAVLDIPISAREYQASSPGEAEELRTPYLEDD